MRKRTFLVFIFFIIFQNSNAQNKITSFVFFNDKQNNIYSLDNPENFLSERALERRKKQSIALLDSDLPVSPAYLDSLKAYGVTVKHVSRWQNGALITVDSVTLSKLNASTFINAYKKNNFLNSTSIKKNQIEKNTQGSLLKNASVTQQFSLIGLDKMHEDGYRGKGIFIAVLDAGFSGVDTIKAFNDLRNGNKILATYDFVEKSDGVFSGSSHGTNVLSLMAANSKSDSFEGGATEASYFLLRTENVVSEDPIEELYWLLAAEYADSAGVDIINSSVGYNTFDNSNINHTYSDLDGKTTVISMAAKKALATGMIVVVSAGNEGANSWRYVTAPADVDSILAVGSVDINGIRASSSSVGPTYDGRIKPDISAVGSDVYLYSSDGNLITASGTSFACPMIASLAAGIWEAHPALSNHDIINIIKTSGSISQSPDNFIGYGIANYGKIKSILSIEKPDEKKFWIEIENIRLKNEDTISSSYSITDITGRVILSNTEKTLQDTTGLQNSIKQLLPGFYFLTFYSTASTPFIIKIFIP